MKYLKSFGKKLFESSEGSKAKNLFDDCFTEICDKYNVKIVHPDRQYWPDEYNGELFIIEMNGSSIIGNYINNIIGGDYEENKMNINFLSEINDAMKRFNDMMEGDGILVFEEVLDSDEIESHHEDIHDAFESDTAILFSCRIDLSSDSDEDDISDEDEDFDDEDEDI